MQASSQWCGREALTRLTRTVRSGVTDPAPAPGTRLIRQWQGVTHEVSVTSSGFELRQYRSLSAVARQITGTPWSGPAFFGLRK